MSFGFVTFDPRGAPINTMTGQALRIVESLSVEALSSGSKAVPGYGPDNAYLYSIPIGAAGQVGVSASLSEGKISWGYEWYYRPAYLCPSVLILVAKK